MGDIKLLDCTLRDGGYVNDWQFGHNNLVSIFERLVDANVDIIEIGFIDDRRPFDIDRSIMPDTDSVERIYGELDRKQAMVVGMIDYGTCSIDRIKPCSQSFLDGIRVIFKKHLRKDAMQYCKQLKDLGYKVFAQLVSVTSYKDEEMMDLIDIANEVKPYAVSMVDTYGLMHQNNLIHYFEMLNANLLPEIGIGYHAHNNFQMGYANCIEMLSHKVQRMMLVDGSIYGMGKSAGNAPIELIAMHLNSVYNKNYNISQFLEAIDSNIMEFYKSATWGYNMFYYLAASNDCHPSYVSDLMDKRTLSVKSIVEILSGLKDEKKLMYDKNYIEQLYKKYQDKEVDDTRDIEILKNEFKNRDVLILGPGNNVKKQKNKIEDFIKQKNPIIVSINFLVDEIDTDYLFLSNSKRYVQLATKLSKNKNDIKVIATSNVTKTSGKFDYMLRYSSLLDEDAEIIDNSFIMLLKVMERIGVSRVYLGGFDGYIGAGNKNYISPDMEYRFTEKQAKELNAYVRGVLEGMKQRFSLEFLTDSLYDI